MLLGQITMPRCVKWAWLHWVALKIITGDISLFPTTCISFSTFVPPSPSLSLASFLSVSLFSLLFYSFFASLLCTVLPFFSSFHLPFFLSFLFCFFNFLLHAFLSSSFCLFAYNLLINPQYSDRHAVMITLRRFVQLAGWTTRNRNWVGWHFHSSVCL